MNTVAGFWNDLQGAFTFLLLLSEKSPLWLWTGLFGLAMALAVAQYGKRFLAKVTTVDAVLEPALAQRRRDRREFAIETLALLAGALSTWLLYPGVPGLLLGILAGLGAPYVWSGLVSAWRPISAAWMRYWSKP